MPSRSRRQRVARVVILFGTIVLSLQRQDAFSQEESSDLRVFGFFQANLEQTNSLPGHSPRLSFSLQQLNLLLAKSFSPEFSCFINFEVTNTFSTERRWGDFQLEEAWAKYHHSNALNIKAGLLIPRFNNMNEIKDRTPLLPYIIRPFVYEESIAGPVEIGDFLPEHAFLQIDGFIPVGTAKFDYAAYIGNNEFTFINSDAEGHVSAGIDTTLSKTIGGRLGVRVGDLRAGASMVFDQENLGAYGLGAARRTKVGADISCQFGNLTLEGEIILVRSHFTSTQQNILDTLMSGGQHVANSLRKNFFYGLANYDFSEQVFGYVGYNYVSDEANPVLEDGFTGLTGGAGFRPIASIVLKAQFMRYQPQGNTLYGFTEDHYLLAVSVIF